MYTTPLYFVRSGLISIGGGRLGGAGDDGLDWSSIASSRHYRGSAVPSAYYLHFYAGNVGLSVGPDNRRYGFPLRCLASVSCLRF